MQSQTAVFVRRVRNHMGPASATVTADATCADVVRLMREHAVSAAIVQNKSGKLCGIVTEQDVVQRLAYLMAADTPVGKIMTAPVQTAQEDDYLYHALAHMRFKQVRHMPVIDRYGNVVGILQQHHALAALAGQMMNLIERLTHGDSLQGMKDTKAAQVVLARRLLRDKVPTPEIQELITRINSELYGRIVALCVKEMRNDGLGECPVDFDVIVMGSGGRGESFLGPDQDNGFILADYPDCEHNRVDAWFIALAERMTDALNAVGFGYCRGHVMATNPLWRKTISQWKAQVDHWVENAAIPLLRLCDIFFDFVPVYGEGVIAAELREHVTGAVRRPAFLHRLFESDEDHGVALGLFGRLQEDRTPGPHRGEINLKGAGILPLVGAVRVLALREGVARTSTPARIRSLYAKGVLSVDEYEYLTDAFQVVTRLLLTQQVKDLTAHRPVGKHVSPKALTKHNKHMLVESFKAIRSFRLRVRLEVAAAAT